MRSVFNPFLRMMAYFPVCILFYSQSTRAQQPISSIVSNSIVQSQVSHTNVKGAGLRNPSPLLSLISTWDSALTSYTVNFNSPATANVLRLSQFSVSSFSSNLITMPVDALVRIRRSANPDVGDDRNYFNFWAQYSSIPAASDNTGIFNFTAPEVTDPEQALLSNNLSSGYDNIFQNTIANPHFGNIERLDFIIPAGLYCHNETDRLESGIPIIDRGTGDPFKIAAITAIDATGMPTAFGSLVAVTAAHFGGNLLPSSFNYGILINDSRFQSESRPSTRSTQNLRGVFISLADLGLVIGQRFYGYAVFGPDVIVADPDWTSYPNNTNGGSQLDPVNIMGLYKTPGSVLPLPLQFRASRSSETAVMNITLYNEFMGEQLIVQQSTDGINFRNLGKVYASEPGSYSFTDQAPAPGSNYYRLMMIDKNGRTSHSEIHIVKFEQKLTISLFPNPAKEKLNIRFPSGWTNEPVIAEIFSSTGQLVKNIRLEAAAMHESISVQSLQPGSYVLRLRKNSDPSGIRQSFTIL